MKIRVCRYRMRIFSESQGTWNIYASHPANPFDSSQRAKLRYSDPRPAGAEDEGSDLRVV
jgi:hypothetical protein